MTETKADGGDSTDPGKCSICYEAINEPDMPYASALSHFIQHHTESETLASVLDGLRVWVECSSCGEEFKEPVNYGNGPDGPYVSVGTYCDDCAENEPYGKILATDVDAPFLIQNQVIDPPTTESQRVELDDGMVAPGNRPIHYQCPECEKSTDIDLPRGNCKHCGVELALEVVSYSGGRDE